MQAPKGRIEIRPGMLEVPQKTSSATQRTTRKLKSPVSSPNQASKTTKDRSPKVVVRRSPRPTTETKRSSGGSELEILQDELKKAKEQLSSSELWKRRAQQEAEEAKRQLAAMSSKLEETQRQLQELSKSEEARIQELRKISQDRDRAWQSELEAVQKQHSYDSAALGSARNEIQRLKIQLERVAQSEAAQARYAESAHGEIQNLRAELKETLALVDKLKSEVHESKASEEQALAEVKRAQMHLEEAKRAEETLQAEAHKAQDAYNSLVLELDQAKNRVSSLEEHVNKIQSSRINYIQDSRDSSDNINQGNRDCEKQLKTELNLVKQEVGQLRDALDAAEKRYQEEYIQSTLQIRSAYEMVERTKEEACQREAELEAKFEASRADVEKLKERLLDREMELKSISRENKGLNETVEECRSAEREEFEAQLEKWKSDLEELKVCVLDKERQLENMAKENEMLKTEIKKSEIERNKLNDDTLALTEAAKVAEQEAMMKLGNLTEEADKSIKEAARVSEQLDAAQAANTEMEAELKRLKIQSDQWRKAAEAAAAMLSTGNNGNHIDRTGSLDYHTLGGKLALPYSEDTDDESPKKKNGNMLKKIGIMLKKGQK